MEQKKHHILTILHITVLEKKLCNNILIYWTFSKSSGKQVKGTNSTPEWKEFSMTAARTELP